MKLILFITDILCTAGAFGLGGFVIWHLLLIQRDGVAKIAEGNQVILYAEIIFFSILVLAGLIRLYFKFIRAGRLNMKRFRYLLLSILVLSLVSLSSCDTVAFVKNPVVMVIIGIIVLWFAFKMSGKKE